eukprot:TRINITY_DN39604_c0_g2_i2.p1 TRINITY_DN39604_c0_g2~~TRINITY_DN39604_c0_g2_i2.p1  ORF type:complete len:2704 (+),score=578.28 TRINITY_DN39604_c0_g2_i2:197-8308(+)
MTPAPVAAPAGRKSRSRSSTPPAAPLDAVAHGKPKHGGAYRAGDEHHQSQRPHRHHHGHQHHGYADAKREEREEDYMNCMGEYTHLGPKVFDKVLGIGWDSVRKMRHSPKVNFSGQEFRLETIEGLMHPNLSLDSVEVLNFSKNKIVDVSFLNMPVRGNEGVPRLRSLQILNLAHNAIAVASFRLPSLLELNLSHNDIAFMPSFDGVPQLMVLLLAHNRIDGTLDTLNHNKKLSTLDISSNRFSWKPTTYKRQLSLLANHPIKALVIWPNPFAKHFQEYQFLAACHLLTLTNLDGWPLENQFKVELQNRNAELLSDGVIDYTVFDIKVLERTRQSEMNNIERKKGGHHRAVPAIDELLVVLDQALDQPDTLSASMYKFEELVNAIYEGPYYERKSHLMMVDDVENQVRPMKPEEVLSATGEFVDKLKQIMDRSDSTRTTIVQALVKMLACGDRGLSVACARLLSDFVDNHWEDLRSGSDDHIDLSLRIFRDLRAKIICGVQSIAESPLDCHQLQERATESSDEDEIGPAVVAECADVFVALSAFCPQHPYIKKAETPFQAMLLYPFLAAICRQTRLLRGPNATGQEWTTYVDFDAFSGEHPEPPFECHRSHLGMLKQQCVRKKYSGYVVEEIDEVSVRVTFKNHRCIALREMREQCSGKTLHIRPFDEKVSVQSSRGKRLLTWDAYVHGLEVLVLATTDPTNAAKVVTTYGAQKTITLHAEIMSTSGFGLAWLQVSQEANHGFSLLMRLAANLIMASGSAGQVAYEHFVQEKLHLNCWSRLNFCLMEGGVMIPLPTLYAKPPTYCSFVYTLVMLVSAMSQGPQRVQGSIRVDDVNKDLYAERGELFSQVLSIVADPSVPDPLLLAASLEVIYIVFLSEITRYLLLHEVLTRLHDFRPLLPYIRGPRQRGTANFKYMELWRLCQVKYSGSGVRERMPELFEPGNANWTKRVPGLHDLRDQLMQRCLLGIVKIIELCASKSEDSGMGLLKNVGEMLNMEGREQILIGPANGLINCGDYDVKIQCLKCISHVLRTSASQFEQDEISWLLKHLQPRGLGVARHDEFLREVINLLTVLVENPKATGRMFRNQFAKPAVLEGLRILKANAEAPRPPNQDEERIALSLKVIEFLQSSSRPADEADLRDGLRKIDNMEMVKDVICLEDGNAELTCQAGLLNTWIARDVAMVLMPLITGATLGKDGAGLPCVIARLADVLAGSVDSERKIPTDERNWWLGPRRLHSFIEMHDEKETIDFQEQQMEFLQAQGLHSLLALLWSMFNGDEAGGVYEKMRQMMVELDDEASERVRRFWPQQDALEAPRLQPWMSPRGHAGHAGAHWNSEIAAWAPEETREPTAQEKLRAYLVKLKESSMPMVNLLAGRTFGVSLNSYHDETGYSYTRLAQAVSEYIEANLQSWKVQREQFPQETYDLESSPTYSSKLAFDSKLISISDLEERGLHAYEVEQMETDLEKLMQDAAMAHTRLKGLLIQRGQSSDSLWRAAREWAAALPDPSKPEAERVLAHCLVPWIGDHGGYIIDPGLKDMKAVERKLLYKHMGRVAHIRDCSRLAVEFKNARDLTGCLHELLQRLPIPVLKFRNCIARPSGLGHHFIQLLVNVPLDLEGIRRHTAEIVLRVSANPSDPIGSTEARRRHLMVNMESVLVQDCDVRGDTLPYVSELIYYCMRGRTLRNGHDMCLTLEDDYRVKATDLHSMPLAEVTEEFSPDTNFILVEQAKKGEGAVAWGDTVSLKSESLRAFLSADNRGYVRFIHQDEVEPGHAIGFVIEPFDENAVERRPLQPHPGEKMFALHPSARVMLRSIVHKNIYLAVLPAESWTGEEPRRLAALSLEEAEEQGAELGFALQRSWEFTKAVAMAFESEEDASMSVAEKKQRLGKRLTTDFMRHQEVARAAPMSQAGGSLRKEVPSFPAVARRQVAQSGVLPEDNAPFNATSKADRHTRRRQITAACLRCVYNILEVPSDTHARNLALDVLFGTPEHSDLHATLCSVATAKCLPHGEEEFQLTSCWLTPKLLLLLSTALRLCPADAKPAMMPKLSASSVKDRLEAEGIVRAEAEGVYDRHQLRTVGTICGYLRKTVAPGLLRRLAVVSQVPPSLKEVILLREYAELLEVVARSVISNEMRYAEPLNGVHDTSPQADGSGDKSGGAWQGRRCSLPLEERAKLFREMIPSGMIRALVQGFLYGAHREALAYHTTGGGTAGALHEDERFHVQTVSSLCSRSIMALSFVMHGCESRWLSMDATPDPSSCEYDVCQAISQAMMDGSQIVAKARIAEFLGERATDRLRFIVQRRLQEDSKARIQAQPDQQQLGVASGPWPSPTERVMALGFAWRCVLRVANGAYRPSGPRLARVLVVVTSSLRRLVYRLDGDEMAADGTEISPDQLVLVEADDLRWVRYMEKDRCFRQYLGLGWQDEAGNQSHELLFYESSNRKRAIFEIMRTVPQTVKWPENDSPPVVHGARGPPERRLRKAAVVALQQRCMHQAPHELVSVSFIKDPETYDRFEAKGLNLLVLTRKVVGVITLNSFVSMFTELDGSSPLKGVTCHFENVEDSDCEEEKHQPSPGALPLVEAPWADKLQVLGKPYRLQEVNGVWFLADYGPKLRIKFGGEEFTHHFFYDSERQRFRHKLAQSLMKRGASEEVATGDQEAQDDEGEQANTKAWHVMPHTNDSSHEEAQKALSRHLRQPEAVKPTISHK